MTLAAFTTPIAISTFGLIFGQPAAQGPPSGRIISTLNLGTPLRAAQIGNLIWNDQGSHTVSSAGGKIHFVSGTTTWANAGTSMDLGIQDLDASTLAAPDGTFDVKATIVPGTIALTGNVINSVAMATGTKTIGNGDAIAVVWDMTARAGADTIQIIGDTSALSTNHPYTMSYNGTVWSTPTTYPGFLMIEADDGALGLIMPTPFTPIVATVDIASNTAVADEYGNRLSLPGPVYITDITLPIRPSTNAADFEICCYTDVLGTPTLFATVTTIDASLVNPGTGQSQMSHYHLTTPLSLAAATVYGITMRPTTTTSCRMMYLNYGSASLLGTLPMGTNCYQIKRIDNTGAFTADATRHFPMILHGYKIDNGAGGGGGGGGLRLAGQGGLAA